MKINSVIPMSKNKLSVRTSTFFRKNRTRNVIF